MPTNFDKLFNQAQGQELINALHGIKHSLDGNYPLEDLDVVLTNSQQMIYPNNNYGFNSVNVPGIALEDVSVTPTDQQQVIYPNTGYVGLNSVTVGAASGGGTVTITQPDLLQYQFNNPVSIDSGVTNCVNVFKDCRAFNQSVEIPNAVTNCYYMFSGCYAFNQLINLPTSLINSQSMFAQCNSFNQPVDMPDTVVNCGSMFAGCTAFNSDVNMSNGAQRCGSMFSGCTVFNKPIILPETVIDIASMFSTCRKFNQPIDIPDNAQSVSSVFYGCYEFNSPVNLGNNAYTYYTAFAGCNTFNQPVIVRSETTNAQKCNCVQMFNGCTELASPIYIYGQNLKTLNYMFVNCNKLKDVYITEVQNTSHIKYFFRTNATTMLNVFADPDSFNYLRNSTQLLTNGGTPTWTEDATNGCFYNATHNIYVYNNWDGVIPA